MDCQSCLQHSTFNSSFKYNFQERCVKYPKICDLLLSFIICDIVLQAVKSPCPAIVCSNYRWSIYFDGIQLLSEPFPSFTRAIESWFSIFWVFSVKYPQYIEHTCCFIERYLCGHKYLCPLRCDA